MKRVLGLITIINLLSFSFLMAEVKTPSRPDNSFSRSHERVLQRWDHKRFQTPKLEPFTTESIEEALSEPSETANLLMGLAPAQGVLFLWQLEQIAQGSSPEKQKALGALQSLASPLPVSAFDFKSRTVNPLLQLSITENKNTEVSNGELYKMAADKQLNSRQRIQVILAIVSREGRGSIPFLTELLKDEGTKEEIRASILGSRDLLGAGSFKSESDSILKGAPNSSSPYRSALWGLGINSNPEDLGFLRQVAVDTGLAPEIRLSALSALTQNERSLKFYLVDFPSLTPSQRGSEEVAEYLGILHQTGKSQKLLDKPLLTHFGKLFAGDSFDPAGTGFGRNSRSTFESIRKHSTPLEREWLDAGIKEVQDEQIARTSAKTPREAVQKLVKAMHLWADDQFAETADYFFGKPFISSWDSAMKHVGFLFLIKAREVSPEAKVLSDKLVKYWLESLVDGEGREKRRKEGIAKEAEEREVLRAGLGKLGLTDALVKMEKSASDSANRHVEGILNTSPIIFIHQYRNLILKEILRTYQDQMNERQLILVRKQLEDNETELAGMLAKFKKGETTTDEITGFNTYALVTTILVSRNPSKALDLIREKSYLPYARYFVDSEWAASPRAGAGRTVPYRLAELVHARNDKERMLLKEKLAVVADNYMKYLPDLMFHSRGRYMHSGEDQIAPYYFHPSVPFEAAALRFLVQDADTTHAQKVHFNEKRRELASAIIASQKPDGTFALPDTQGDLKGGGAYPSSPAWVNPLTGLALLSLIDDAKSPSTQYGILDPGIRKRCP